jgi:uncharacterized membrane protein
VAPASAVATVAGLAWPVLSHGAALAGRPEWMPTITALVATVILSALVAGASGARVRIAAVLLLAAVALAWRLAPAWLLFLPPAAINVAFGVFFAATLRPGQEPRIARYARRERGGDLPVDLARYTRRLTWLWSAYFFVAAAAGLLLAAFAPLAAWSAFANVGSYVLVALLFVGEYAYRRLRFRHYTHAPLFALVAIVVRDRAGAARGSAP